jgi:hypothetical protein
MAFLLPSLPLPIDWLALFTSYFYGGSHIETLEQVFTINSIKIAKFAVQSYAGGV